MSKKTDLIIVQHRSHYYAARAALIGESACTCYQKCKMVCDTREA